LRKKERSRVEILGYHEVMNLMHLQGDFFDATEKKMVDKNMNY